MKLLIILLVLLTSCQQLPPCAGSEEQIYRCESLRIQEESLRRTRFIQQQQFQQNWNNSWNKRRY